MASEEHKAEDEETTMLLNLLKFDNKGWNMALFQDKMKITTCICQHCKAICRDAVELGCDHKDDEIFTYCEICLSNIVEDKNGKCPINNHDNPIIFSSRSMRRQISKSIVICPYSAEFIQMNKHNMNEKVPDNQQIMDTPGHENQMNEGNVEGMEITMDACT